MFGHDWQSGEGTVVDIIDSGAGIDHGDHGTIKQSFLVDVTPGSGESFRCQVPGLLRATFRAPEMGDVVQLQCDPGRQKAKFVPSDPMVDKRAHAGLVRERREADQARYEAEHRADDATSAPGSEAVRRV